jgi:hypothetical protein
MVLLTIKQDSSEVTLSPLTSLSHSFFSSISAGKKASASEDRSLVVHADPSVPDAEICLEFNTAGDREKWFEVLSALLLASSTCPHYLQSL